MLQLQRFDNRLATISILPSGLTSIAMMALVILVPLDHHLERSRAQDERHDA